MALEKDGYDLPTHVPGTYTFRLLGGLYALTVVATWGGGNLVMNILGPDGTTYVAVLPAITSNGFAVLSLPKGAYEFVVTTATGVYAKIVSVPT